MKKRVTMTDLTNLSKLCERVAKKGHHVGLSIQFNVLYSITIMLGGYDKNKDFDLMEVVGLDSAFGAEQHAKVIKKLNDLLKED